ncbi:MAG: histidine phosphatase family protein [Ruminococcus callidus]
MKILLIRHGDPDYEKDSLTEKGWHEAELLAQRMAELEIQSFYVSPLGRAKDTASCTLKKWGGKQKNWRGCGNSMHRFRISTRENLVFRGISFLLTGPQNRNIMTISAGQKLCRCWKDM